MKNLPNLLLADWVVTSFPIIRIVLVAITAVCAIAIIFTTLFQSNSNQNGSSALTGGHESYYAENKGENKDVKLTKITIALASTMTVCMVLYFVSLLINNPV